MSTKILDSESPLDESILQKLEEKLSISLPTQYRKFLLLHNGGTPVPRNFKFGEDAYQNSRIHRFLAVWEGSYSNFESYYSLYKTGPNSIPDHLVPIAHDEGGNLVCISISGSDTGKIYFWDHEEEPGSDISLICDSFDEFTNHLH